MVASTTKTIEMIREHKLMNDVYIDVRIARRMQCLRKVFVREFDVSLR